MVRTLYDEDGNEVQVPDEKELKGYKLSAKKVARVMKSIAKIRGQIGLKKGEKISDAVKKLNEEVNPNFGAMRDKLGKASDKITALEKQLEEAGVKVEKTVDINPDEIIKNAQEAGTNAATQTLIDNEIVKFLKGYDDKQKPVVQKFYDKLIAGEEVNLENVSDFFGQAVKASGIEIEAGGTEHVDGGVPKFKEDGKEDFAETEEGKKMGKEIFGDTFGQSAEERQKGDKE